MEHPSAAVLHRRAIVIDAVAPLLWDKQYLSWYREGGVTAVAPTITTNENAWQTLKALGGWHAHLREHPELLLVRGTADIQRARDENRLGLILHFQGADPLEDDVDLVDAYRALGVGVIQLCYNVRNRLGDGSLEASDAGLSRFGRAVVERCNAAGVVVDCSHTGERTSLEAIQVSRAPVIVSHANARAVHDSRRNISDRLIRAIAESGGVVGAVAYPGFVSADPRPTLDQLLAHIEHLVQVAGIEHVSLGLDYFPGQHPFTDDAQALAVYRHFVDSGQWDAGTYPPPPYYYPEGLTTPREIPNLTAGLLGRGYSAAAVEKILGGNLLRVYRAVWGD